MKSFALLFLGLACVLSAQVLDMTTPMHGDVVYQENFDKTTSLDGFTFFSSDKWKIENGKLSIVFDGRLDTITAPELEKELKDSIDGVSALTLDFSALEYISSAGLRVLLSTQKLMNKQGKMTITHVNEIIMEIFDVTGFTDILDIE